MAVAVSATAEADLPRDMDGFLAWEAAQPDRYEWLDGEITLMVGAPPIHALVVQSLVAALRRRRPHPDCLVSSETTKLLIPGRAWLYPDVMVQCAPFTLTGAGIEAPVVIAEVLSPGSVFRDYRIKWRAYQEIPSLRLYLMLDRDERHAEWYRRAGPGDAWTYGRATGPESRIPLPIGFTDQALPLFEVYGTLPDRVAAEVAEAAAAADPAAVSVPGDADPDPAP